MCERGALEPVIFAYFLTVSVLPRKTASRSSVAPGVLPAPDPYVL